MKRPSPASVILGFCLTAMAGLLGYQQHQLIHSTQAWRKTSLGGPGSLESRRRTPGHSG